MAKSVERDHVDDFLESIRDELPDLDFEVEGIVDRIMGLSRRIKRMMEETCAEHGLTWGEWKVLGYLHRTGRPDAPRLPGPACRAPRAVERGDDQPARPPRGGRADRAPA